MLLRSAKAWWCVHLSTACLPLHGLPELSVLCLELTGVDWLRAVAPAKSLPYPQAPVLTAPLATPVTQMGALAAALGLGVFACLAGPAVASTLAFPCPAAISFRCAFEVQRQLEHAEIRSAKRRASALCTESDEGGTGIQSLSLPSENGLSKLKLLFLKGNCFFAALCGTLKNAMALQALSSGLGSVKKAAPEPDKHRARKDFFSLGIAWRNVKLLWRRTSERPPPTRTGACQIASAALKIFKRCFICRLHDIARASFDFQESGLPVSLVLFFTILSQLRRDHHGDLGRAAGWGHFLRAVFYWKGVEESMATCAEDVELGGLLD